MSYMSSCDELAFRGRRVILLDKLHQFVQEQWEAEVKQRLRVFCVAYLSGIIRSCAGFIRFP